MDQDDSIEIDMTAALQDMSADFGDGGDGGDSQAAASPSTEGGGEPPPPSPSQGTPPPAPEPWMALPKSWKKEYEQDWQNFRPEFKQYAHTREQQMLDGLMMYKTQLDPYLKMQEHYKPYLEQHKVTMPEVTQRMINSHLALLYAEPQVKMQYLQGLIRDYNLEPMLRQLFGGAPQGGQPGQQGQPADITQQLAPIVQQMIQQHVAPIQQQLRQRQEAEQLAAEEAMQAEVDKFIADPQNPFAGEVVEDMTRLISGGLASTLKDAYEMACRLNPVVAKKILDAEVAKLAKPQAPAPRNVRSGSTPPALTAPTVEGDIEATMRRVLSDINSR